MMLVKSLEYLWCLWLDRNPFHLGDDEVLQLFTGNPPLGTIHIHDSLFVSLDLICKWLQFQGTHDWWYDYCKYKGIRPELKNTEGWGRDGFRGLVEFWKKPRNLQLVNFLPTDGGEVTFFANSKITCESFLHEHGKCEMRHHYFICWKYVEEFCPKPYKRLHAIKKVLEDKLIQDMGYQKIERTPQIHGCPCVEQLKCETSSLRPIVISGI
jgi:hypothetical protein